MNTLHDGRLEHGGTDILHLALPTGNLEEVTLELFRRAGWNIRSRGRGFFPDINDPEIRIHMIRAEDIPGRVEKGECDAGITGLDLIFENNAQVSLVVDLPFSRSSFMPSKWAVIVRHDSPIMRPEDLNGRTIRSELPVFTIDWLDAQGIKPATLERARGGTEGAVAGGWIDAGVVVVESGDTLIVNQLRPLDKEVLPTAPYLIANTDRQGNAKIVELAHHLTGIIEAETNVFLTMNVPDKFLDNVLGMLPSAKGPTDSPVRGTSWHSVSTMVPKSMQHVLIPELLRLGVDDIIQQPIQKTVFQRQFEFSDSRVERQKYLEKSK